MSEQKSPVIPEDMPIGPPEINMDTMVEFLEDRNIDTVCPACRKKAGWTVYFEDRAHNIGLATPLNVVGNNINMGGGIATVPISCNSCGYMRYFAANIIYQWLNEKATNANQPQ